MYRATNCGDGCFYKAVVSGGMIHLCVGLGGVALRGVQGLKSNKDYSRDRMMEPEVTE